MATERQEWIWEEYRQDFAVVQGEGERGGKGESQISSWAISSESTLGQREAADEGVKTKRQLCSRWVVCLMDIQTEDLLGNWIYGSRSLILIWELLAFRWSWETKQVRND